MKWERETMLSHRSKYIWLIVGAIISVVSLIVAVRYFPQAFPIVDVTISMDRTEALKESTKIAQSFNIGPEEGYRQAVIFNSDQYVQQYVEMEAGGADAYRALVAGKLYSPYTWQVRHFKPLDVHEVQLSFTPEGKPYGFVETISEEEAGPSLSPEEARVIAQEHAAADWSINFDDYSLVESSRETMPNGRTDHTFVYERPEKLGEAFYRLSLKVSGEKLITLAHSMKIPEAFGHRYAEMRSANETIATAATYVMFFLYIGIIALFGLFFLIRRRWIIWYPAIIFAGILAILGFLAQLNSFPLIWMAYKTDTSLTVFLLNQFVFMVISFISSWVSYTFLIAVAEGLTRKVFGNQIQFWKLWRPEVARSYAVLFRTIASYLLVPVLVAYTVLFYIVTTHYFGWWLPSQSLFDPNVLATYLPWLNAVQISLQAGFTEELMFRALPLASAAWLGKRYGRQSWWIAAAFVLQALVFSAAHANYAMQPAYARVVELLFISTLLGFTYLRFGLLPAILMHVFYDLALFSIPLFIANDWSVRISQGAVILLGLIPLFIVLVARLHAGAWQKVSSIFYNKSWQPPEKKVTKVTEERAEKSLQLTNMRLYTIVALGIIGVCLWLGFTKFVSDAPGVSDRIGEIQQQSYKLFAKQRIELDDTWTPLAMFDGAINNAHRFVWQQDTELYRQLLGSYLQPPHWLLRMVHFSGTLEERSEQYVAVVSPDNTMLAVAHSVLDEVSGAKLDEQSARAIAQKAVKQYFDLDPATLKEISAESTKQPSRVDWLFTFADPSISLQSGEARINIWLTGDMASGYRRFIFIPEQWSRARAMKENLFGLINLICTWGLLLLLIVAAILIMWRWRAVGTLSNYGIGMLAWIIIFILIYVNSWPTLQFSLNTHKPMYNQLFAMFGGLLISIIGIGALLATLMVIANLVRKSSLIASTRRLLVVGISLGCWLAGIRALFQFYEPSLQPFWGSYAALSSLLPSVAAGVGIIVQYFMQASVILIILGLAYALQKNKTLQYVVPLYLILEGVLFIGMQPLLTVPYLLISGIGFGVAILVSYYLALQYTSAVVPIMMGVLFILLAIQQVILGLYPLAVGSMIVAIGIIAGFAWLWYRRLAEG